MPRATEVVSAATANGGRGCKHDHGQRRSWVRPWPTKVAGATVANGGHGAHAWPRPTEVTGTAATNEGRGRCEGGERELGARARRGNLN